MLAYANLKTVCAPGDLIFISLRVVPMLFAAVLIFKLLRKPTSRAMDS